MIKYYSLYYGQTYPMAIPLRAGCEVNDLLAWVGPPAVVEGPPSVHTNLTVSTSAGGTLTILNNLSKCVFLTATPCSERTLRSILRRMDYSVELLAKGQAPLLDEVAHKADEIRKYLSAEQAK